MLKFILIGLISFPVYAHKVEDKIDQVFDKWDRRIDQQFDKGQQSLVEMFDKRISKLGDTHLKWNKIDSKLDFKFDRFKEALRKCLKDFERELAHELEERANKDD